MNPARWVVVLACVSACKKETPESDRPLTARAVWEGIESGIKTHEAKRVKAKADEKYALATRKYELPADTAQQASADSYIRIAYAELDASRTMAELDLHYVQADGALHPDHGFAHFLMAMVDPKDIERPIGAPVPATSTEEQYCAHYEIRPKQAITKIMKCTSVSPGPAPRCTVVEVWKRAIAAGAMPKALAQLTYRHLPDPRWTFTIQDPPRGIFFQHFLKDDCEVTVEKP